MRPPREYRTRVNSRERIDGLAIKAAFKTRFHMLHPSYDASPYSTVDGGGACASAFGAVLHSQKFMGARRVRGDFLYITFEIHSAIFDGRMDLKCNVQK